MKEIRLLTREDIEVKVKQVTEKGVVALLYKTARTDMQILDETFGAMNWETDYKEIKGNLYCGIGIRDQDKTVWKWDCGIESREDGEGNEKKGEASDAFKRAGFKWGIGRELYTAPFIFIRCETYEKNGKYYQKNRFAKYDVKDIRYDEKRIISHLEIVDEMGTTVFKFGKTNGTKIEPTSHENTKVDNQETLTYAKALNLTFKDKKGNDVALKSLDVIDLSRLIKTTNPEYERLREGAKLILEFKAKTEGAEQDA